MLVHIYPLVHNKKKNEEDGKRYDIENANSKMKSKENSGK
jgi:hypothetical protein